MTKVSLEFRPRPWRVRLAACGVIVVAVLRRLGVPINAERVGDALVRFVLKGSIRADND